VLSAEFELKATDLAGRICRLKTKTSEIETPALLPVIHPVKQLVPCSEIRAMGYEAVMTNAYTTFRRLRERAGEGIHKIIGFDGTVMTDSGGYQVLEFGSVDVGPTEIVSFEEKIGSDIAIVLDKPTGLNVTKQVARLTVEDTIENAKLSKNSISREDMVWTLPIQGGRYLDLVRRSARASAKLDFGYYALGSPVEVMEEYDFALLVGMIIASKEELPRNKPFHLFGAGHPLILPLAVALGCDTFDSASYMLYAKHDRYLSSSGTSRLAELEYLSCPCKTCSALKVKELKSLPKEERTKALAMHNLYALRRVIQETKQAVWEGRLWEYVKANSTNHPNALEAFQTAVRQSYESLEEGTPRFKDRGIFIFDEQDLGRPEIRRVWSEVRNLDFGRRDRLVIVPETKTKPFLTSSIFLELIKIVNPRWVVASTSPLYGAIPSEISDIFPISQSTQFIQRYPDRDALIWKKKWKEIHVLTRPSDPASVWLRKQLGQYAKARGSRIFYRKTYKGLKEKIRSSID
jgi:7-cyano-7-deazaguanine tRNA-ribosyltransferase